MADLQWSDLFRPDGRLIGYDALLQAGVDSRIGGVLVRLGPSEITPEIEVEALRALLLRQPGCGERSVAWLVRLRLGDGIPKLTGRSVSGSFRLTQAQAAALDVWKQSRGVSQGEAIRALLCEALERTQVPTRSSDAP